MENYPEIVLETPIVVPEKEVHSITVLRVTEYPGRQVLVMFDFDGDEHEIIALDEQTYFADWSDADIIDQILASVNHEN